MPLQMHPSSLPCSQWLSSHGMQHRPDQCSCRLHVTRACTARMPCDLALKTYSFCTSVCAQVAVATSLRCGQARGADWWLGASAQTVAQSGVQLCACPRTASGCTFDTRCADELCRAERHAGRQHTSHTAAAAAWPGSAASQCGFRGFLGAAAIPCRHAGCMGPLMYTRCGAT